MNLINQMPIEITDATLSGHMRSDGIIEWYINIDCASVEFRGHNTEPRIYIERFEWEITSINEILNKRIYIENGSSLSNNTILPGERLCCLYAFEHQFLDENEIYFYIENDELLMRWKARNSNKYSERYEINLNCKIDFLGINLGGIEIEEAMKTIRFNTIGLNYYKEDGVLYLIPE